MYKPDSLWTWCFLLWTLVQSAAIIALEAYPFAVFEQNLNDPPINHDPNFSPTPPVTKPVSVSQLPAYLAVYTRSIPTFLTLYLFAVLYQIVLTIDALRLKNTIQIIGLCILNLLLMVYGAAQIKQIDDAITALHNDIWPNKDVDAWIRPSATAVACVLGVGTLILSFIAWKLYHEFAWTIYKHISADLKMKRRYLTYQIYIALLKFDFFFFLGFTIQFLVIVITDFNDPEFGLTCAAVPITIIILLLAAFFTRREMTVGMVFINILYVAGMAYFIFKLVRIWDPQHSQTYTAAAKPLTIFAVITIILLVCTLATSVQCTMNFNMGLKPHISRRKPTDEEEKAYVTEMPNLSHAGAPVPSRMTIE